MILGMDGLLESISKALILNASDSVYMADMPIKQLIEDKNLSEQMHVKEPLLGPTGLLVKVNTKSKSGVMNDLVNEVMNQLAASKTIDPQMLRQLHACRLSSFEETVEVFLFSLEDTPGDLQ